jgi:hypothetical protein
VNDIGIGLQFLGSRTREDRGGSARWASVVEKSSGGVGR